MKCPHCVTGISADWEESFAYQDGPNPQKGTEIYACLCPECNQLIIKLVRGDASHNEYGISLNSIDSEEIIYPKSFSRPVEPEVKDPYRTDYIEASSVLKISPKASAALSRRVLQTILRDEFSIKEKSLAKEIDAFINLPGIPSHITEAVDAVRNVGNFAAHPLKDTNTKEIVEVEPGEAEWLLDVLEALFDFVFVQPKRLEDRKQKLNNKLSELGKPPMKG